MSAAAPARFVLTGRKVAWIFVLFFGTVASADAVLVVSAVRTWSGAETTSAYKAGQLYNREIALARAQEARGWTVQSTVARRPDGAALFSVELRDPSGRPLPGRTLDATLQRPADKRGDRVLVLREASPGTYAGVADGIAAGQWDLVVDVVEGDERAYRRKTRVVLR